MRKGWFGTCFYTSCQRVCTQGSGGRFRYELGEYALQRVRSGHVFCHQYHAIDEIRANVGEFRYVAFWNAHSRACHTYVYINTHTHTYIYIYIFIFLCGFLHFPPIQPLHQTRVHGSLLPRAGRPLWRARGAHAGGTRDFRLGELAAPAKKPRWVNERINEHDMSKENEM
jgi:hypothetical protein